MKKKNKIIRSTLLLTYNVFIVLIGCSDRILLALLLSVKYTRGLVAVSRTGHVTWETTVSLDMYM